MHTLLRALKFCILHSADEGWGGGGQHDSRRTTFFLLKFSNDQRISSHDHRVYIFRDILLEFRVGPLTW